MRCGFLISTILALFLGGYAIGKSQATDKPTISLGPVRLHLAMSKELVIGALSPYYDVDELGMVTTKKGPPHESVGQVVFKDGRLSQVWKDWTLKNQEEGYELANHTALLTDLNKKAIRSALWTPALTRGRRPGLSTLCSSIAAQRRFD